VTREWRIDKFPDYWGGWTTAGDDPRAANIPYHVDSVIVTTVGEWATRKLMFLAGDFDQIAVPRAYMFDLLEPFPPYDPLPGIICEKDLPTTSSSSLHYIFNVAAGSPYMPTIGGSNQSDFFDNAYTRKAFSNAVNFTVYLSDAWFWEAEQRATWHISGLAPDYRHPNITGWDLNYTAIEENLKLANYGGPSLWDSGFSIQLAYNEGNDQRRIAAELMEQAIESLNPSAPGTFVIDVVEIDWDSFLEGFYNSWLPILIIGWLADFLDVDNWARPYMHSYGDFAWLQGYSNPTVDVLIDLGVKTPDGPERQAIYYELQEIWMEDCPTLMLVQALGRSWRRNWVQGWKYSQLEPGLQFYERWKGFLEDFNRDLKVNLLDLVQLATKFGQDVPPADPKYDLDKNGKINLLDLVKCAKMFGAGV
jgi:peptide/nickel transport system substrate-binding protein